MFEIKFKIFNSFIGDDDTLKGEYGYFLFNIHDKFYGEYIEEIDIDILSMNIYSWFMNFMKSIQFFENKNSVYISDVETQDIWIKMINKDNKNIQISKIHAEKPEGSKAVETDIHLVEQHIAWEKIVGFWEVLRELIYKGNQYLSELKKINNKDNQYIQELETMINDLKIYEMNGYSTRNTF